MSFRILVRQALIIALAASAPVYAQSGLRLPERGEPGIDPGFARGWLAPEYDRFGFASYHWRDAASPRRSACTGRTHSASARSLGPVDANSRGLRSRPAAAVGVRPLLVSPATGR